MAISVSSPYEWTDTDDEKLFLKYNFQTADREISVERILIVEECDIQKLLETKAIVEQIVYGQKSAHFSAFYIYKNEVPSRLLREISDGFLLFEDVAVAKDADPDANGKDIEGFLEMTYLERYKNIFNSLKNDFPSNDF